jgi:hypothetical protein
MNRITLTANERSLTSICAMLACEWFHEQEKQNLIALLAEGLLKCRTVHPLGELVTACHKLLGARSHIEWLDARSAIARAVVPVLRLDVVVREPVGMR